MLWADYFLHDDGSPKKKKQKHVKRWKKVQKRKVGLQYTLAEGGLSVSPFKCYNAAVNDSIIPENNGHQSHSTHVAPDRI